jgi:hypothetical protein
VDIVDFRMFDYELVAVELALVDILSVEQSAVVQRIVGWLSWFPVSWALWFKGEGAG